MADSYKELAQVCPSSANTDTTLYTVPSATQAVLSGLTVSNITTSAAKYRVAVRIGGAAISSAAYKAYDITLPANDSVTILQGLGLAAADVITVRSDTASALAFTANGMERT